MTRHQTVDMRLQTHRRKTKEEKKGEREKETRYKLAELQEYGTKDHYQRRLENKLNKV